ncbi:hypothetical protein [Citrobacter freundii]|uniref:Uncharacterized protein n=1 Tax=Citrobacter freundii TaxID=546 RepID=A0A7G2IS45_CITFR|nr:hypothetical protein [Citrobacter freundii]
MWDPDAFEPGSDDIRAPAGSDRGEVLDPKKFKGTNALKRKINPTVFLHQITG